MKTDEETVRNPRVDWMQALSACEQQLTHMAGVLKQVVKSTGGDGYLGSLYEDLEMLRIRLTQLTIEVEMEEFPDSMRTPMQLTIGEVLALNRLREKVRKMEQSVFMLRYKVNLFFSSQQAA